MLWLDRGVNEYLYGYFGFGYMIRFFVINS